MRYDAFISYRHAPLDMEVAKKVHTGLETYRIPGAVRKKTGKNKMGRVFRDQEELPIGSDLDDNISSALKESNYLIVICSPRTPDSYWVCKEIETYIEMHGRSHILAVLIEGEPDESFPSLLLKDDNGDPVEPLAADVRGADKKERNRKFKTEILRLVAPVIGCTYDDLKQRHRERVIRRTVAIVSSIAGVLAVAGTAFGIYNANVAAKMKQLADEKAALADEKSALAEEKTKLAEEITVQYRGKQENQSRFYKEEALSLLKSGNREDAVLVAMEGLPSDDNDRPYVADAEYALSRALYAYDNGSTMTFDRILSHDLAVYYMYCTDDKSMIITTDSSSKVYIWNVEDWSLKLSIDPAVNDSGFYTNVKGADADDTGVYVAVSDAVTKYDYDGNVKFKKEFEGTVEKVEAFENDGTVAVICRESISILDADSGQIRKTFENTSGSDYIERGKYDTEIKRLITPHYNSDVLKTCISVLDPVNEELIDIDLSEAYYLDCCVTPDGNIAAISCNPDALKEGVNHVVVDLVTTTGERLWSSDIDAHVRNSLSFSTIIKAHKYQDENTYKKDIVITIDSEAFTLDEETGQLRASFSLPGDAFALSVRAANSFGQVGYREGGIDLIDFASGRIVQEYAIETEEGIKGWLVLKDKIIYSSFLSPDLHVLTWHSAPDIEDHAKFEESIFPKAVSSDGSYYAVSPQGDFESLVFVDKDGRELYSFDGEEIIRSIRLRPGKAYFSDMTGLHTVDLNEKKETLINIEDYGFNYHSDSDYVTPDGSIAAFWNSKDMIVFDSADGHSICSYTADGLINKVFVLNDGSKAFVLQNNESMYVINTVDGSRTDLPDDYRLAAGSYDKICAAISPDDKYIALCCMDGILRVADAQTYETVAAIPLKSYLKSYVSFTDDGTHLVMQGDDYRIRILDMAGKKIVCTMDSPATIDHIVCDEDSGLMAICQGYGLYLLETKGYGCVAYASRGLLYLKSNDSILLSTDRKTVERTFYKDYKALIKEAQKQFPGAKLSDEEKIKYNIN